MAPPSCADHASGYPSANMTDHYRSANATTMDKTKQTGVHTSYGKELTQRILAEEAKEKVAVDNLTEQEDLVLKTFRLMVADLCQQFKGGHPG